VDVGKLSTSTKKTIFIRDKWRKYYNTYKEERSLLLLTLIAHTLQKTTGLLAATLLSLPLFSSFHTHSLSHFTI
jgi:hypothetical protein